MIGVRVLCSRSFRRAFAEYWSSSAISLRMDAWAAANSSTPDTSAADVDGTRHSAGHHESVGERQGRQPGSEESPFTKPLMEVIDPGVDWIGRRSHED